MPNKAFIAAHDLPSDLFWPLATNRRELWQTQHFRFRASQYPLALLLRIDNATQEERKVTTAELARKLSPPSVAQNL